MLRAFGNRNCVSGGSFNVNGSGKFNDITDGVLKKLKQLSVGAVWYTGVIDHATRTHFPNLKDCTPSIVKGEAGSPYAIRNYFDVDPSLAVNIDNRMAEFQALIDRTHKAGMKVVIDFVPNHVYREYGGYLTKENFYVIKGPLHLPEGVGNGYEENPARATGNNVFTAYPSVNDWYETVKLNYENHSTWIKMRDILMFWAAKGVDGFRCDMVEMVTPDFFKWAFVEVHEKYRNVFFIAEVYDKSNYARYSDAGFDLLYDKSGFYDALRAVSTSGKPAHELSWEWQFLGSLQPKMLNFLENHDEQRLASDFYLGNGRYAMASLAVSLLFNTASFLLYFGQEFGERGMETEGFSGRDGRTSIFDYCCVPSIRRWLDGRLEIDEQILYKEYCKLMRIATSDAIFSKGDTYDLMYANQDSPLFDSSRQFVWLRGYNGSVMLLLSNFSTQAVEVEVNVPSEAFRFFGIAAPSTTFSVKANAHDYAMLNISSRVQ